jgi:hypothetical protein
MRYPTLLNQLKSTGFKRTIVSSLLLAPLLGWAQTNSGPALAIGQDLDSIKNYVTAMGSTPAAVVGYIDMDLGGLETTVDNGAGKNNVSELASTYPNSDLVVAVYAVGRLNEINNGALDGNIEHMISVLKKFNRHVYLRFGYEYDGAWNNYEPNAYKLAYLRIRQKIKEANAALSISMVWQSSSYCDSTGNVLTTGNQNFTAWYPGAANVDFVGLSYFTPGAVSEGKGGTCNVKNQAIDAIANFARAEGKPLMIAESTPQGFATGQLNWRPINGNASPQNVPPESIVAWHEDFFKWISDNDVRVVTFINANWNSQSMWASGESGYWGDSRVESNTKVKEAFQRLTGTFKQKALTPEEIAALKATKTSGAGATTSGAKKGATVPVSCGNPVKSPTGSGTNTSNTTDTGAINKVGTDTPLPEIVDKNAPPAVSVAAGTKPKNTLTQSDIDALVAEDAGSTPNNVYHVSNKVSGRASKAPKAGGGQRQILDWVPTFKIDRAFSLTPYYVGGGPGPKDQWGDSQNTNKANIQRAVFDAVVEGWDELPENVQNFFSSTDSDALFCGLTFSPQADIAAYQKAAVYLLGIASNETGGSYDMTKLPSYWRAAGDGGGAGETQFPGMRPDPIGMTYGMFSTFFTTGDEAAEMALYSPHNAILAELQRFGYLMEISEEGAGGFNGAGPQAVFELIGASHIYDSINRHGLEFLANMQGGVLPKNTPTTAVNASSTATNSSTLKSTTTTKTGGRASDITDYQAPTFVVDSSVNSAPFFQGGTPIPRDSWGYSKNTNIVVVQKSIYSAVVDNWENIAPNVREYFSTSASDTLFKGLSFSSDSTKAAQQKTTVCLLGIAAFETFDTFDVTKLPSYWRAGGSGTGADQTQFPGMAPDPEGMTYGMFSTFFSTPEKAAALSLENPRNAALAELQRFGYLMAIAEEGTAGFPGVGADAVFDVINASRHIYSTIASKGQQFLRNIQ